VVDILVVIANSLATRLKKDLWRSIDDESAAHDCSARPRTLAIVPIGTKGADCDG